MINKLINNKNSDTITDKQNIIIKFNTQTKNMSNDIPASLKQLLTQLNNYIMINPQSPSKINKSFNSHLNKSNSNVSNNSISFIKLSDFWKTDRLCVTLQEFQEMLISIGYFIKQSQRSLLVADGVELITLENVLEGVQQWKWTQKDITCYLSNKSKIEQIQQQPPKYHYSSSYMNTSSSNRINKLDQTKSFLNQHIIREQKNKLKLMNTLKKAKNQQDYEFTVKVGQVNDICRKLKNGVSYILDTGKIHTSVINNDSKISNRDIGQLTIIQCSKDGRETILKLKDFQRRYQIYKQAIMNQVQEFQGSIQQDLKQVLVEVMCLRSQMQQQMALLQRKGVSS